MKKLRLKLSSVILLTILVGSVALGMESDDKTNPNVQKASIVPEWFSETATVRGYDIERTYGYGKTFYVLVDSSGNPIQMIATN